MKLVEKRLLSCATCRVSAMASVLGTSRGSGGLSSQLRCKSKRRRRRRSKRKGKDLLVQRDASQELSAPRRVLWAGGLACVGGFPGRCWWDVSAERGLGSSDTFVNGWGAFASPEGTLTGHRAQQTLARSR